MVSNLTSTKKATRTRLMKVNMRDVAQVFLLNKSCSQFVNLTVSKKPLSAALKVTKDAFTAIPMPLRTQIQFLSFLPKGRKQNIEALLFAQMLLSVYFLT